MLNTLLLADLRNVNQTFLHAQTLYDCGLRASADRGYRESVWAMNRSMRLMLAMMAADRPLGFNAVPEDDPLAGLQLETEPAQIFTADLAMLDRLLAHLRRTLGHAGTLRGLLTDFEAEHLKRRAWLLARIEALPSLVSGHSYNDPMPPGERSRLDELRELSRNYHPAWAEALPAGPNAVEDAPLHLQAATSREVGRLIGAMLVLQEQCFVHAFLLRHWGRQTESNSAFGRAIDDMRHVYMLCELALLRGAPAAVAMPHGRDGLATLGADAEAALLNERQRSLATVAQIDRTLVHANNDPVLTALLASIRTAHHARAVEVLQTGEHSSDAALPQDRIAAMLVRWGISDPTAAHTVSH